MDETGRGFGIIFAIAMAIVLSAVASYPIVTNIVNPPPSGLIIYRDSEMKFKVDNIITWDLIPNQTAYKDLWIYNPYNSTQRIVISWDVYPLQLEQMLTCNSDIGSETIGGFENRKVWFTVTYPLMDLVPNSDVMTKIDGEAI
jgi:hypothetical protein